MADIKVFSHRSVNLHSESASGGLIHVEAKKTHLVPSDVTEHPGFKLLVDAGTVRVLKNDQAEPEPEDVDEDEDKDEDEDEE